MENWEVILKAGLEGGSIALYGRYIRKNWTFKRDVLDQTPAMIDEPTIQHEAVRAHSWAEALASLDKHPWHLFCPLQGHPLFRCAVLAAMRRPSKHNVMNDDYGSQNCLTIFGGLPQVR